MTVSARRNPDAGLGEHKLPCGSWRRLMVPKDCFRADCYGELTQGSPMLSRLVCDGDMAARFDLVH